MNSSLDAKFSEPKDVRFLPGNGENLMPPAQENFDFSIFSTLERGTPPQRTGQKNLPDFSQSKFSQSDPQTFIKSERNKKFSQPNQNLCQYSPLRGFFGVHKETRKQEKILDKEFEARESKYLSRDEITQRLEHNLKILEQYEKVLAEQDKSLDKQPVSDNNSST